MSTNIFLAVFLGERTGTNAKAWAALTEDQRQAKQKEGGALWGAWMQKHHAAIVQTGGPLGKTKRATKSGIADVTNNMSAFVIVRAESHEAAAQLFENHPHFSVFPGDGVDIMPVMPIPNVG